MNPVVNFEQGFIKTVRWTLFTDGAIIILVGALGALYPLLHAPSPPTVMGLGLLISGLNYLVPYISFISLKNSAVRPRWFLIIGVLNAVFGVLFLTRLGLILFRLPALAGTWMIFAACARAVMAFENFKSGFGKWWITLTVCVYMMFSAAAMTTNTADIVSIPSWSAMIVCGMFIVNEGRKLLGESKSENEKTPPPRWPWERGDRNQR